MAEKVATAGIRRKKGFMLYVKDGAVWRVRKKSEGEVPEQPEMVSDLGFEMDANYIYFVDKDGDVSRTQASGNDGFDDDEDEEDKEEGVSKSDQKDAEALRGSTPTGEEAPEISIRNDYVAYHSEAVMGYPYVPDESGRVSFPTTKSEGVVRRVLGNTVWVFSGVRSKGKTHYQLQGNFQPDDLVRGDDAWEISGPGVFPASPVDVSDEPWFRLLLGEQANFSLGLNRIRSASILSALASVLVEDRGRSSEEKLPEEVIEGAYREGQGVQITVNRYERDPSARAACLKHFGPLCQICRIDLSTVYGPQAAGLVHVHHLRPLSQVEGEYEVRPEHDLIPVCPNCHAVVHRNDPLLKPDEVREMIAQARESKA
jgi:hypothetical protein